MPSTRRSSHRIERLNLSMTLHGRLLAAEHSSPPETPSWIDANIAHFSWKSQNLVRILVRSVRSKTSPFTWVGLFISLFGFIDLRFMFRAFVTSNSIAAGCCKELAV